MLGDGTSALHEQGYRPSLQAELAAHLNRTKHPRHPSNSQLLHLSNENNIKTNYEANQRCLLILDLKAQSGALNDQLLHLGIA